MWLRCCQQSRRTLRVSTLVSISLGLLGDLPWFSRFLPEDVQRTKELTALAHCGGNPTWPIHQSRIVDSPTGLQKQVPTDIPEHSSHRGTEELPEVGAMNSRGVVANPNSPHFEHCLRSMRCAPQFGALYNANFVFCGFHAV